MSSKNTIKAGIANNALVVSFPSADAPRVWRADMALLMTAALEVQENQGKFSLVMKRSGSPEEEIATFADKKAAAGALQTITDVLLDGTTGAVQAKTSSGWFGKLVKFIFTVAVLFVVLIVIANFAAKHGALPGQGENMSKAPTAAERMQPPPGVPAPADDVIGK